MNDRMHELGFSSLLQDRIPVASMPAEGDAAPMRILVLSVSAGAGHVRAAEAIRRHAEMHRRDVSVIHLDAMDFAPSGFRMVYTDFYLKLVSRHPAVWSYLYQRSNEASHHSHWERLRRATERLCTRALRKKIADIKPDAIVCTHFLPAEMLSRMIAAGRVECPVWVQVTDFDLHRMWVHDNMAGYFAANEEVAYRMRAGGINADKIHVTGIPVMPVFGQACDRAECAGEFGIDPQRMTILLMGGGAGMGRLDDVAERLLQLNGHYQLVALAGRNHTLLEALRSVSERHRGRLVVQGYTEKIERLMACADVAVTKPGGLTVSECLAVGLPMIVNEPIPGQEERNADFLLEQGAALKACDPVTLEYRIRYLLRNPEKLADMRAKAAALAQPDAALRVLERITGKVSA